MAELIIRVGTSDADVVTRLLSGPPSLRPSRLVVDAHVATQGTDIAAAAATAGVPYLIDPQTYYLQDHVHPSRPWARLPFAATTGTDPADLADPQRAALLAESVIGFQLASGATRVVVPYVHIESASQGWEEAQLALWHATRVFLDRAGLNIPVTAVLALGWRLLPRRTWPGTLARLMPGLMDLGPDEVALAASKVDEGVEPDARLVELLAVVQRLTRRLPVVMWQQGALGEVALLAGAVGYETGLGWRERCNLQTAKAALRGARQSGGGPRPVYVSTLRRSVEKRILEQAVTNPRFLGSLACLDPQCCPHGIHDMLEDARQHAVTSRLTSMRGLLEPAHELWRWTRLEAEASAGLDLANRINAYTRRGAPDAHRIDTSALQAMWVVAQQRRDALRRRRAA